MAARPHMVIVHRWLADYAHYERYVDHSRYAVSYVTTEVGAPALPASAAQVAIVDATDDLPSVADAVKRLAENQGRPEAIIALKEDDLLVGAQLRQQWGCPGPDIDDVIPFRDKLVMAGLVSRAGLAVPAHAPVRHPHDVVEFGRDHGWPVVVKPCAGSSSAGVIKVDGPSECAGLEFAEGEPHLVQAFDGRQIYHVDGYFDGRTMGPLRASRYVNNCLGFRTGDTLGSVEEDDPDLMRSITAFSTGVMRALSRKPVVFHLELFVDRVTGSCAFLEVGARVGGAEIPYLWREVHGYDLMESAFRLLAGQHALPWPRSIDAVAPAPGTDVAGWLLAPAPTQRPCRITHATSMVGRVPGPYAEALLRPGEILPAADAYYEHVGGRFRFRGRTSREVEDAIVATSRDFHVSGELAIRRHRQPA